MSPPVAPCAKVRWARAPIFMQRDRNLSDAKAAARHLENDLTRELHAGCHDTQTAECGQPKAAHPRVDIGDWCPVKQAANRGKYRRANEAMEPGHSASMNMSAAGWKPTAQNEIRTLAQFREQSAAFTEIVTAVAISIDHVWSARCRQAGQERHAITPFGHRDDPHTCVARNFDGAVGASVVGDNYFPYDSKLGERTLCLSDARAKRLRFIEAWHDDSDHRREIRLCLRGLIAWGVRVKHGAD